MDGVSWSTARSQESFSRSNPAADTLSRLASFIARAETKQHTRNQRPQPSHLSMFVCSECGKSFNYAPDLLQHQEQMHTLPKPHRCPFCGQEFSLRSSLQLHKCDHGASRCELCHSVSRTGSPCLACTSCTSDPLRPQDKSLHRQPHILDSSPYTCAPCGRGFSQKQALLHHQQAGCSEPPQSDTADANSVPDYSPPVSEGDSTRSDSSDTPGPSSRTVSVCHFCSRIFRTEAALRRHKQTDHPEKAQVTKRDRAGGELRNIRNTMVNGNPNERPQSRRKLLTCRSCDMVFKSTSKLYMHRKEKHSRERNSRREPGPVISKHRKGYKYPCQVCSKVFFHHLSLRTHYRQHAVASLTSKSKGQSVECTTKDFTLLENVPNEVRTADNKPVQARRGRPRKLPETGEVGDPGRCRVVTEVEKEEDEQEKQEEEEEREFPCPSCAEVFPLQWELKEHVKLHQASVRRRQCSVCTSMMDTCKWPGSKKQRLYHCVPCQQGFSTLDSFLEHCQEHLRVRVEQDSIMECYAYQASKA